MCLLVYAQFLFTSHSSFLRVMPLGAKHGQLLFKSTTRASFSSFVDVDSVVISMLFDSKLTVPDALSARQLKQRKRAIASNPFTTAEQRKKAKAVGTKEAQVWEHIEVSIKAPGAGSAASMCSARGRRPSTPTTSPLQSKAPPPPAMVADRSDNLPLPTVTECDGDGATQLSDDLGDLLERSKSCPPSASADSASVGAEVRRRGRPRKVCCAFHFSMTCYTR